MSERGEERGISSTRRIIRRVGPQAPRAKHPGRATQQEDNLAHNVNALFPPLSTGIARPAVAGGKRLRTSGGGAHTGPPDPLRPCQIDDVEDRGLALAADDRALELYSEYGVRSRGGLVHLCSGYSPLAFPSSKEFQRVVDAAAL